MGRPPNVQLATFKIEQRTWQAFRRICKAEKVSASQKLREMVEKVVGKLEPEMLPGAEETAQAIGQQHD